MHSHGYYATEGYGSVHFPRAEQDCHVSAAHDITPLVRLGPKAVGLLAGARDSVAPRLFQERAIPPCDPGGAAVGQHLCVWWSPPLTRGSLAAATSCETPCCIAERRWTGSKLRTVGPRPHSFRRQHGLLRRGSPKPQPACYSESPSPRRQH